MQQIPPLSLRRTIHTEGMLSVAQDIYVQGILHCFYIPHTLYTRVFHAVHTHTVAQRWTLAF